MDVLSSKLEFLKELPIRPLNIADPKGCQPLALYLGNARRRVERICRAALAEPDRHAALRFLNGSLPDADALVPGLRNQGLFATHELHKGLPRNERWASATKQAAGLLSLRGDALMHGLGYSIEQMPGPVVALAGR